MKRVLIRPSFHDWCGNALFTEGTSHEGVYRTAFASWRERARERGYRIDTWDMADITQADIFWFLDLPPSRREFREILGSLRPDCRLVLQVLESPALNMRSLIPSNWSDFDAVISYQSIGAEAAFIPYRLPIETSEVHQGADFTERKPLLMLNTNRVAGFWAIRETGLAGLPGVGDLVSGWTMPTKRYVEKLAGELYSDRRRVARAAEQVSDTLEIRGKGWNGEKISWFSPYGRRRYHGYRKADVEDKSSIASRYRFTLAFENFAGDHGYISEKIFDAIRVGSVPIYKGDRRISESVPREAFVDATRFKSEKELLEFARDCSESSWIEMRDAGSKAFPKLLQTFGDLQFVDAAMQALAKALP